VVDGPTDNGGSTATEPGADTATQPTANVSVSQRSLGRYEIESLLGVGGMGVVYAAFDPELERRVALKVLPDAQRGHAARERLLREARAMARLTHPNVVRVYEVDSVDGHDFVAMELVDGGNLADWLREQRSPEAIVDTFVAAGRGLVAAHAAGVVHRDFKPQNVLVSTDGRILVTDFGLARGVDPTADERGRISEPPTRATPLPLITQDGSVVGTPAYMAPEQRDGGVVGPAADQFSFCVALWEALAGQRPYRGNALELARALERGPAALDTAKLPRRLRAPLLRGLEPDPAKRWPTMKALLVQVAPPARRWLVPAMIGGGALMSLAAFAFVIGMRGADGPSCTAPLLDPDTVWPAGSSAKLTAMGRPGIARLLDRDIAGWKATRATACKTEPKQRETVLGCLDGVLARFDVIVNEALKAGTAEIDPEDLIEPGVCARSNPRLPRTVSAEYRDVVAAVMRVAAKQGRYEPDVLADLDARAKQDPCARALATYLRYTTLRGAPRQEAMHETQLLADRCGDDQFYATLVLKEAAGESSQDAHAAAALIKQAETAVAHIPTSDLQAKLEITRLYAAEQAKQIDAALDHGNRAIAKLDERGCMDCSTRVALVVGTILRTRATPADLIAVDKLFEAQRAKLIDAVGADSAEVRSLDSYRAYWIWSKGDLAHAHRVLDAGHKPVPIQRARQMKVAVVDLDGQPVAGATVTASSRLYGDSLRGAFLFEGTSSVRSGITNARGELDLPEVVPEGVVIAEHGDRRSSAARVADTVKLVLEPTSHIRGRVALDQYHYTAATIMAYSDDAAWKEHGYYLRAPVHSDGTFELAGVLRRPTRVGVGVRETSGSTGRTVAINVDRATIDGIELSLVATRRTVHVLVRSTVRMAVPAASVMLYAALVETTTAKDLNARTDSVAQLMPTRVDMNRVPAEVKALARRDDLYGQFDRVPDGAASLCATGLPEPDDIDDELQKKIMAELERVEVRCVPLAADAKVIVIEVPPFPRFD
jgi:predicted Ser/Thr protein kinase